MYKDSSRKDMSEFFSIHTLENVTGGTTGQTMQIDMQCLMCDLHRKY